MKTANKSAKNKILLSDEQNRFIEESLKGKNILVDACIGSGKTTAIQMLCKVLPVSKNILYLTYNRLLKADAQKKIKLNNVVVQNYHGFAYKCLKDIGISCGVNELVLKFNECEPPMEHFDVLIIDEYQDIQKEYAIMLQRIKESNKNIQIIAVGDMCQRIYDHSEINVESFINEFLEDYISLQFTQCFRLSQGLANFLGRVWNKNINGVNENCKISIMKPNEVVEYLSQQKPKDILCLGKRTSSDNESYLPDVLNQLENKYPQTFNKKTVYASIRDQDKTSPPSQIKSNVAIFTTYDSSKGLERKICVVFNFYERYWQDRTYNPQQSYEILRNIFCVAASRGKEHIIFVDNGNDFITEDTLKTYFCNSDIKPIDFISKLFDFKYTEDIVNCFNLLKTKQILIDDTSIIDPKSTDYNIDLSPCIGIFQEAIFFENYDIDEQISFSLLSHKKYHDDYNKIKNELNMEKKTLYLTSLETEQDRYFKQVSTPFIGDNDTKKIIDRLGSIFKRDEKCQVQCNFYIYKDEQYQLRLCGLADVVKDNIVYELKFVSELEPTHFLQCACYMIALNLEKGILWNVKSNKLFEIYIPDRKAFLDSVIYTITKHKLTESKFSPFPSQYQTGTSAETVLGFAVGDKICHTELGVGKIIKLDKINDNRHSIKVLFEKGIPRTFDLEISIKYNIIKKI